VLEPVLAALERGASEAGGRGREPAGARRATRAAPARLRIRRERIRDGWALRVTGPDATPALIEAAMARAAWLFGPA
jgi:hypothetical protein